MRKAKILIVVSSWVMSTAQDLKRNSWLTFVLKFMNFTQVMFAFVGIVCYVMSGLGITAGAHRLWAHRSYRAKLPLRILLAIWNSMAFQVRFALIVSNIRFYVFKECSKLTPIHSYRGTNVKTTVRSA